jgi:hypothetical protein
MPVLPPSPSTATPPIHAYSDLVSLKAYMAIQVSTNDGLLDFALGAASRAIDSFCQRRFWLDDTPVARTFIPQGLTHLELDDDIGSTTGLVIKTDASGDGTFETTWTTADYQLLPVNAAAAWPEAKPWTEIRAVGTKTFPWLVNTWLTRLDRVQITAAWGWPAVPDPVVQACLIKASRLFHRKDSPQGIAGFGDFGPVRLSRLEDGDVLSLLSDYRRVPVLVA